METIPAPHGTIPAPNVTIPAPSPHRNHSCTLGIYRSIIMLLPHMPLSAPLFLVAPTTDPTDEGTLCIGIGLAGRLMLPHSLEMFEGFLPAELT